LKFLVTGGGGFVGSNLVESLLNEGHHVKVLDNFSTGKKENIYKFEKDIELIEGDVRNYNSVIEAVRGTEIILHQAALTPAQRSLPDPVLCNEVNINGTINILDAAKKYDVQRVVFASSSSVYGNTKELPKHENLPLRALTPFALTKLAGEGYCRLFSDLYGLETISLRYFSVFGPKQDSESQYSPIIPKFIKTMLEGSQPVIYGDGEQSRDFVYVSNIVKANYLAATADIKGRGEVINCASNEHITLNQLVDTINDALHSEILPIYSEPRKNDIKHLIADISLAEKLLGYKPEVSFKDGLELTVEFFKTRMFPSLGYDLDV
jgi:UDP-glucose 4-epimerase